MRLAYPAMAKRRRPVVVVSIALHVNRALRAQAKREKVTISHLVERALRAELAIPAPVAVAA